MKIQDFCSAQSTYVFPADVYAIGTMRTLNQEKKHQFTLPCYVLQNGKWREYSSRATNRTKCITNGLNFSISM